MKKFLINFKHTVVESYQACIEAETEEDALEYFNDGNEFEHLTCEEPYDVNGLSIDVESIKETT